MNKPAKKTEVQEVNRDCFVIMPISDPEGYDKGHFDRVYEDIFKPACVNSGFEPVRADAVKQTNLIHLDILQKLIDSPVAICDLSSRNPNVLFELGLRQAFDKPTVLVQENGTPQIFDIAPLRYYEYRRSLRYREVLEDQVKITEMIKETYEASKSGDGVNSIVRILSITQPAKLMETAGTESSGMLQLVREEINALRYEFRNVMAASKMYPDRSINSSKRKSASDCFNGANYYFNTAIKCSENGKYDQALDAIDRAKRSLERGLNFEDSCQYKKEFDELFSYCKMLESKIVDDINNKSI